jgi:CBS domain containing-hemolysin-like protein
VVVWLIIALLIAINALYVAAEFAAVSVRTSRIQQEADRGSVLARRLLPYLRDAQALDRYIAACQIGITVSSLILGAYGQATLSEALTPWLVRLGGMQTLAAESAAVVLVLLGLTALQMILGELIPKSIALQSPARIALQTVLPMRVSLLVFSWFIRILNGSGILLLRLFRFQHTGHRHIHSPDELELLLAESREGGHLRPDEHRRLRKALRLGLTSASQLMVPRVRIEALDLDTPPSGIVAVVRSSPFTRLPVFRDSIDEIVGIVHAKDVAARAAAGPDFSLSDLIRPALLVPESMRADELLVRMRQEKHQLAIVLDEFGGTAGLVTIEDVLEEVMGDIIDERKPVERVPERLPDGRVRLPGTHRVDEIEAWTGSSWTPTQTFTVGGRVVEAFGRVPSPGERIRIDDTVVEVERVERAAIMSVLVTPAMQGGSARQGEPA